MDLYAAPSPTTDPEKMSMQGCMQRCDPHCSGSKWAAADQYSAFMSESGGGSNGDPSDGEFIIMAGPVALTRLLSYSFLEAAKS